MSRSILPTPLTSLSTPYVLHGLDYQRFFSCRDLLRTHETDVTVLREGLGDNVGVLRAKLYETKLELLATQLAYKELSLSVGSCFCQPDSTFQL
jgi:hypothetical protein